MEIAKERRYFLVSSEILENFEWGPHTMRILKELRRTPAKSNTFFFEKVIIVGIAAASSDYLVPLEIREEFQREKVKVARNASPIVNFRKIVSNRTQYIV